MNKYLKDHYLIFSLGFFFLLFLSGTLIFNSFWSGVPFPSFATTHNVRKDYISTYIALLSFLGTLYGAALVIYAYGGWKEQSNHETKKVFSIELLKIFLQIRIDILYVKKYRNFEHVNGTWHDSYLNKEYEKYISCIRENILDVRKNCELIGDRDLTEICIDFLSEAHSTNANIYSLKSNDILTKEIVDYYYNHLVSQLEKIDLINSKLIEKHIYI
ncbi:hypothetical protein [Acinetobacter zhairhuonensis]|uniref:hypothetical protein n=1 Tax=Acinetobacter sp. A7.4 TaxID=2919921 RepID=UPI001F4F8BCE|nr:hypothetical protein [Acinetobacter sp. A7.4]MCJ8163138.1 hypothetical protein [Acinetobacter sp. A7.4]